VNLPASKSLTIKYKIGSLQKKASIFCNYSALKGRFIKAQGNALFTILNTWGVATGYNNSHTSVLSSYHILIVKLFQNQVIIFRIQPDVEIAFAPFGKG